MEENKNKSIIVPIFKKVFADIQPKKAYLNVVKFMATNIISNEELNKNIVFSIEKQKGNNYPSFVLTVYAQFNESETIDNFCEKCREVHNHFYINDAPGCSECKLMAFKRNVYPKLTTRSQYKKEKINDNIEKNERRRTGYEE